MSGSGADNGVGIAVGVLNRASGQPEAANCCRKRPICLNRVDPNAVTSLFFAFLFARMAMAPVEDHHAAGQNVGLSDDGNRCA